MIGGDQIVNIVVQLSPYIVIVMAIVLLVIVPNPIKSWLANILEVNSVSPTIQTLSPSITQTVEPTSMSSRLPETPTPLPTTMGCGKHSELGAAAIGGNFSISYPAGGNCFLSPQHLPLTITWGQVPPEKYYLWVLDNPHGTSHLSLHALNDSNVLSSAGETEYSITFADHNQHDLIVILAEESANAELHKPENMDGMKIQDLKELKLLDRITEKASTSVLP